MCSNELTSTPFTFSTDYLIRVQKQNRFNLFTQYIYTTGPVVVFFLYTDKRVWDFPVEHLKKPHHTELSLALFLWMDHSNVPARGGINFVFVSHACAHSLQFLDK